MFTCGDTINGKTTNRSLIVNYTITITTPLYAIFNSCESAYDTYLYLYNIDGTIRTKCDDCGDCGLHTILTTKYALDGEYILGI